MKKKDILLLLGANQYLRERALSGARKSTDAEVWIADSSDFFNKNRYFDGCFNCDQNDSKAIISLLERNSELRLLAAIPLNDWVLKTANDVNEHFGLRHLKADTIENSRNKHQMKVNFLKYNVPTAKFYLLSSQEELDVAIKKIGLPVVIKPYDFGGSGGVYLAKTLEEARKHLDESQNLIALHKKTFKIKGDKYLIEEYINSTEEVSVEVICFDGKYKVLSVTEKYLSPEPWFCEMGHLIPSHRNHDDKLRTMAVKACKSLGIDIGMAHVEIKIKNGEHYVIEAAARPGGDGIMDQIEKTFGINPYNLHILTYLGIDATNIHIPNPKGTAAIAFLKAKEGIIKKINKLDHSDFGDEITSLKITAKEGMVSNPPMNWSTREGVVEYYWDDTFFNTKTDLPVTYSKSLSSKIFDVE
ncbi:ATP-grasp domain-containing protein [Serratia rubidaea]|nr:ATP-grasp domain-containing protein [Serratia rubidaea]